MKTIVKFFVCLFAGAGAGIGTGFAGMSAAAVIGPIMMTCLGIPAYEAIGIGLASDVLASMASAMMYRRNKNLDVRGSLPLLASVLLMTVLGSYVASHLPEQTMGNAMLVAMFILGLRFVCLPTRGTRTKLESLSKRNRVIRSLIGGALIGFICGFVGAGGGMMMLFVLTSFLGYDMHMAVGTSVFIMSFTALTGSVSHFVIGGMPDLLPLLLCVFFTLAFALGASKIANMAQGKTLNRIVGIVLLVTACCLLLIENL